MTDVEDKDRKAEGDEPDEQKTAAVWKGVVAHFGVFAALIPIVVAAVRILALSQGDVSLIPAIVSSLDVKTIVFGSVIPLMPGVSMGLVAGIGFYLVADRQMWIGVPVAVSSMLLLPFSTLGGAMLGLVLLAALTVLPYLRRRAHRMYLARVKKLAREIVTDFHVGDSVSAEAMALKVKELADNLEADDRQTERRITWVFRVSGSFTAISLLAQMIFVNNWLPLEVLRLDNNRQYVATVLESDDSALTVLYKDSRKVERINKDAITSRQVCTPHDVAPILTGSMLMTVADSPRTLECPQN